jgi:hypothetical protein
MWFFLVVAGQVFWQRQQLLGCVNFDLKVLALRTEHYWKCTHLDPGDLPLKHIPDSSSTATEEKRELVLDDNTPDSNSHVKSVLQACQDGIPLLIISQTGGMDPPPPRTALPAVRTLTLTGE